MQGFPERVLAPQRGLDNIGPILRRVFFVIFSPATERDRLPLQFVVDRRHRWLPRVSESRRFARRLRQCVLRYIANNRLTALTDRNLLYCDLLLATILITIERLDLHYESA